MSASGPERESQRNVELMWLTRRLAPDFKTIANFRKDNGKAIRNVCRQFMEFLHSLDPKQTLSVSEVLRVQACCYHVSVGS
jgi:hypothetical protein